MPGSSSAPSFLSTLAVFLAPAALGQAIPDFVHGDECLFCHRKDIGASWQKNAHGTTIRQRQDALELVPRLRDLSVADEVEYFLGGRNHVRFLRKHGYGKFAILSPDGAWDRTKFGDRCAGCHATAVDSTSKTFAFFGLDCYTCHGVVDLNHSSDTSLVWLSKKRRADAKAITSTCAQCHLRGGKSRSTGLPYPNIFIAGGDLFQDFQADFSAADDAGLNPGDRHVWRNVRDVVLHGSQTTCLSCHAVHANSSAKHRRVLSGAICQDCHYEGKPRKLTVSYTVHSSLCEY